MFCTGSFGSLSLSSFSTQMIRKSVETRDWLNTIEPRNVRAVMKRIVEDVTAIDTQVGLLYEEGVRKAHSSGLSSEEPPVRVYEEEVLSQQTRAGSLKQSRSFLLLLTKEK